MRQVIVVGAGNWGKNLIRNFYALDALAGIVEVSDVLQEKVRHEYPDIPLFTTYEQAIASGTEAIVLATPALLHFEMAMQALKAGKDVFVEKPMTLKTDDSKELAKYADDNERILMVGHLLLYQPAIAWMREYLASGKAGKVLHVSAQRAKLGRVRREENVWWSFCPHDVSVVLDLLGNPDLVEVQAFGQSMLQPGIEDNVHVDMAFDGNRTAHIHASWLWPLLQRSTTVITEEQMLVYDEVAQSVTIYDKGIDADLKNRDDGSRIVDVAAAEPLRLECQHFLDCIEKRQRPLSDGWNGVAVVEVLEKAQECLNG